MCIKSLFFQLPRTKTVLDKSTVGTGESGNHSCTNKNLRARSGPILQYFISTSIVGRAGVGCKGSNSIARFTKLNITFIILIIHFYNTVRSLNSQRYLWSGEETGGFHPSRLPDDIRTDERLNRVKITTVSRHLLRSVSPHRRTKWERTKAPT